MSEHVLVTLVAVVVLGIGAQWLAWRLRVPSILLLLALGFLAGPISGLVFEKPLLDPEKLMADLLLPFVSLSVALILFEGGLTLRFAELRDGGAVMRRLVTVGAIVTWVLASGAALLLLGLSTELAILLGAILVVTGPTVIVPLMREIRPKGRVGAILKWEGIVIDPIGAMLAVLVFEVISLDGFGNAATEILMIILRTVLVGGVLGVIAGYALALLIRAYWIPDFLDNAVSLMFVLGAYAVADLVQPESGLFTVTIMGITLANQRLADVRHIVEFKENLRVLLISSLFILLAARLKWDVVENIGWASVAFLVVLIVIVRPLSVFISAIGSPLKWPEKLFLAMTAPRGIVAASVSAVFALRLNQRNAGTEGSDEALELVPITFTVIVGTVMFCSLVLPAAARWLKISEPNPQGVLFIGAQPWARAMAIALAKLGVRVHMVDTNRRNITAARMLGLDVHFGNVLSDHALEEIDLSGIGKLIAATPNDSVNLLAVQRFSRIFGRSEVFCVPPQKEGLADRPAEEPLHGRWVFGKEVTTNVLADRVQRGATVKATQVTEEFTFEHFRKRYGAKAIPLFIFTETKKLVVITDGQRVEPKPGQTLISLVDESAPKDANNTAAA